MSIYFGLVQDGRTLDERYDTMLLDQGAALTDDVASRLAALTRARPQSQGSYGVSGAMGFTPRRPMTADPIGAHPAAKGVPGPGQYRPETGDRLVFSRGPSAIIRKEHIPLAAFKQGVYRPPELSEKRVKKRGRGIEFYKKNRELTTGGPSPRELEDRSRLGPGHYDNAARVAGDWRSTRGGRWQSHFSREVKTKRPDDELLSEELGPGKYRAEQARDKLEGRRVNRAYTFSATPRFAATNGVPGYMVSRPTGHAAPRSRRGRHGGRRFIAENVEQLADAGKHYKEARLKKMQERMKLQEKRQQEAKARREAEEEATTRRLESLGAARDLRALRFRQKKWLPVISMLVPTMRMMVALRVRRMRIFAKLRAAADQAWMGHVVHAWRNEVLKLQRARASTTLRFAMRRSAGRRHEHKKEKAADVILTVLREQRQVNGIVKAINRYFIVLMRLKTWWLDRQAIGAAREALLMKQFDRVYLQMQISFMRKTFHTGVGRSTAGTARRASHASVADSVTQGTAATGEALDSAMRARRRSMAAMGENAASGIDATVEQREELQRSDSALALQMSKALEAIDARRVAEAKFPEIPTSFKRTWVRAKVAARRKQYLEDIRKHKEAVIEHRKTAKDRMRLEEAKAVMSKGSLSKEDQATIRHFVLEETKPELPTLGLLLSPAEAKAFVKRVVKAFTSGKRDDVIKLEDLMYVQKDQRKRTLRLGSARGRAITASPDGAAQPATPELVRRSSARPLSGGSQQEVSTPPRPMTTPSRPRSRHRRVASATKASAQRAARRRNRPSS